MSPMTPIQIKHALEEAGYSQAMVAKECNVSAPTIHKVIKGITVSTSIRCHIAKLLNKPVEEVFTVKLHPTRPGPCGP